MRKWILKGTTLKTPFHVALFRMKVSKVAKIRNRYNQVPHLTLHFLQGRISAMPEVRADLFLAISKTGMCLLTLSVF